MGIDIVKDANLLEEMDELRLRLARTTQLFLNSKAREVGDGQIVAVFLDMAFEILSLCEVTKEYVMELAGRQFEYTQMRVSMEQRERADVQ
jgi:preprotein translocase subunit Sec63